MKGLYSKATNLSTYIGEIEMIELGIIAVLFIVASIIFGICATGNDIIDRDIDKAYWNCTAKLFDAYGEEK